MMDFVEDNPFKKLESHEEVSDDLKIKVMTSVNIIHILKDFVDLFSSKLMKTAIELFDNQNGKEGTNN